MEQPLEQEPLEPITADEVAYSAIIAQHLGLRTSSGVVYRDVDLQVPRGFVTAVCCAHNLSRTALLLTLTGRMASNEGTLSVYGFALPKQRRKLRKRAGLGFFAGVNEVDTSLTVVALTTAELQLYGKPSGDEQALEYLRLWGLASVASKCVKALTREEYVRLGIALGMVGEPCLLAVSDVESGLSVYQSRKLMRYLMTLTQERREQGNDLTILVGCSSSEIAQGADVLVELPIVDEPQHEEPLHDEPQHDESQHEELQNDESQHEGTHFEKGDA